MPRFARHNKNLLRYFAARGFYFFFFVGFFITGMVVS
jgi:hypothetical protein